MVKAKPQKSKTKKQPHTKTHGKQADISKFRGQLDTLGLKIIQVTADGNCFFRALADQLEGNEEEHQKYRSMVVQYIAYISPRWYIRNFDHHEARMVHLSYHDGEHYNSVRLKEDSCTGSARPIMIKADADISAASNQSKTVASKCKGATGITNAGSIKLVMAGSGYENLGKVEEVLLQVGGDVDAAIEFLIAEQGEEEYTAKNNNADMSYGDNENGNGEQHEEEPVNKTCEQDKSSNSIKRSHDDCRLKPNEKKIPRNKVCPCGSKKKYKACCGSATGRSSVKIAVNLTVDSKRGRKERKQGKKGEAANTLSSVGNDGGPPDMGALCI